MATAHIRTFGDLLRRSRLAAGLTLEELAERAGLSAKGIGALERGERRAPRRETVALLADALQLADADRAQFESVARHRTPLPITSAVNAAPSANLPPLIGRTAELALLERHLSGEGCLLLFLAGEPGIGKTRLLREVAELARVGGWAVLEGGCHRSSGQEPYAPILTALERRIHGQSPVRLSNDLEGCSWLVRLLPELAEITLVPTPQWNLPPPQERRLMFAAVGRYLANLAGRVGALLILDDLQWAGADALDLLATLARAATDQAPLRIVGAYRGTEVQPQHPLSVLQHELMRESLAIRHELEPLRPEDASALLNNLLGIEEPGAQGMVEARERVLQRAGGMPLFLVSYAQRLDADRLAVDGESKRADVPDDVADSIRQRVAVLPRRTQRLLGIAAVAGRSSTFNVLVAAGKALSLSEADALDGLHDAAQAKLLLEGAGGSYSFAHDLIHEVITADLGSARVTATHRHIAEALEELPGASRQVAELAWHFAQGGAPDRALPYALLAGAQAEAVYANAEAERHYETALELAREVGDRAREGEALERLGSLHWMNVGDYTRTMKMHEQAIHVYRMLGDRESEIRTAAQLARAYARSGRPGAGRDLLTPLLDGSQQMKEVSEHPETHALLLTALADVCFHGGDYREQLASSERAVSLWRAIGNAPSLVDALDLHGVALRLLGQWQDALRELQEVASLMEQTGALYVGAHAGNHLCYCYLQSGQWNLAVAAIERAQNAAERAGSGSMLGGAYFPRGLQSFYAGDWPTARMWFERAADLLGGKLYSISLYAPLGRGIIRLATGEKETGLNFLLEALALAEQRGFLFGKDRIQRELAEAELVMGRASSALMRLESRVTQPVRQEENDVTPMMPLLAWVYLELGGGQDVEALLDRAAAQARIQHHHLALVDTMRIRGLLYARQRRWQEAAHALDEALALCRSMPHPYAEAKALYIYGQMHLARDEPERAREDFTAALAILNRLGERLYAEHVERALAEIDG